MSFQEILQVKDDILKNNRLLEEKIKSHIDDYGNKFTKDINAFSDRINKVNENNSKRVTTSEVNQVINEAIAMVQPPSDKGKRLKIFYGTQASIKPPTFVIFVNQKDLFHFSYERYIVNQIRREFNLTGTPIRIIVREKMEKE